MRAFKYHHFHKWAKKEKLSDQLLLQILDEIEKGIFEANLGAGLYKKRIARSGQGKQGGFRTIIAFKRANRAIFIYGFAKNDCENISLEEKDLFKHLAKYYLNATDQQLAVLIERGELIEVVK